MRRLRAGAAGLAAALLLAGCGGGEVGSGGGDTGFLAGTGAQTVLDDPRPAPPVTATFPDGEPFDLQALRGEVVVLNTWWPGCAPCRREAPALAAVSSDLADDGVRFVGVQSKGGAEEREAFVERFGVPYPSLDDREGRVRLALRDFLPPAEPGTVVLDRRGRVVATVFGEIEEEPLRELLEPFVAEPAE